MELVVLTVPDCPNAAVFDERLAAALADFPTAAVHHRVIADAAEAAEVGMHGSPTLLVNGADPFAEPGQLSSVSCRLQVPSVQELRRVLGQATTGSGIAGSSSSGSR